MWAVRAATVDRVGNVTYQRVTLVAIVLLALTIRLMLTSRFVGLDSPPDADAGGLDVVDYEGLAWRTVSGDGYVLETGEPTARRSPGTSFTLVPIYLVFGHSYLAAHVWFCMLSSLTCAALYAFGRAAGQAHIGLLAALLLAVYPPHAYLAMHFFSETPFALAVTIACAATLSALKGNAPKYAIWAGIAWGCAHLIRPMAIVCIPIGLVAFALIREWHTRLGMRQCALILIAALTVVTPWMIRNANVIGTPTVSTLVGGYTFWGANNTVVLTDPRYYGSWEFDDERLYVSDPPLAGTEPERKREAWRRGLEFVREHKGEMPGLVIARVLRLAAPFQATANRVAYYALGIPWLLIAPFFVVGVFTSVRKHLTTALVALIPIAATIATAAVFYGSIGFRDAVAPQLVWFAAVGIVAVVSRYLRLEQPPR